MANICESINIADSLICKSTHNKYLRGYIRVNHTIALVNPCKQIPEYESYFDEENIDWKDTQNNTTDCEIEWQTKPRYIGDSSPLTMGASLKPLKTYRGCKEFIKKGKRTKCYNKADEICFKYTHVHDIFYIARQTCLKYIKEKMQTVEKLCSQNEVSSRHKRDGGLMAVIFISSIMIVGTSALINSFSGGSKTVD